jgi:O-antigen ligase
VAVAPLHGVTGLLGSRSSREGQGAIVLGALVVVGVLAAAASHRLIGGERPEPLQLPRRAGWVATALVCGGLAVAIVAGAKENNVAPLSRGARRLVTLQSNRYAYWRVALRAFADEPLHGVGAGGWSVWWLRHRDINEFAQDAHSLPLQTLAELGLVGGAALLTFFGGVAIASRDALRMNPASAAGPVAALVVYAAHAPLDWDWQMPAVTLVAVVLAGRVLAVAQRGEAVTVPRRSAALRG